MKIDDKQKPIAEYFSQTPGQRRIHWRWFFFSICAGAFGSLLLICAILMAIDLVRWWAQIEHIYIFTVCIYLLIGAFCLYKAAVWMRHTFCPK